MKIEKTGAEAMEFANGLDNANGDADLFLDLWNRGDHATIRGHFPAFAGGPVTEDDAAASTDAPAQPVAATKTKSAKK